MKRIATIVWNCCIIAFITLATMALLPKIQGQFEALDKLFQGSLRDWTEAMGYIGLGLLLGVIVSGLSVSSPLWGRVPILWRILFGLVYLVFIGGAIMVSNVEREFVGSVTYMDYLTFLGCIGLFILPSAALGRSIPFMIWQKINSLKNKKLVTKVTDKVSQ